MLSATNAAISGSRIAHPVKAATATPIRTPAEVKTLVSRCRPSATKAGERSRCPNRIRTKHQSELIRLAVPLSTEGLLAAPLMALGAKIRDGPPGESRAPQG